DDLLEARLRDEAATPRGAQLAGRHAEELGVVGQHEVLREARAEVPEDELLEVGRLALPQRPPSFAHRRLDEPDEVLGHDLRREAVGVHLVGKTGEDSPGEDRRPTRHGHQAVRQEPVVHQGLHPRVPEVQPVAGGVEAEAAVHHLGADQPADAGLLLHQQPGPPEVGGGGEAREAATEDEHGLDVGVCAHARRVRLPRTARGSLLASGALPMRITCPSCQTAYNIDERRIPPGGAKLKCSTCQTLIPLRPPEAAAPVQAPSVGGVRLREGAVPLPGLGLGPPPESPAAGLPHLTPRTPEPPPPVAQSNTTGVIPMPPARSATPGPVPSLTAAPPVPPPRRADRTMVSPGLSAAVELPAPGAPPRVKAATPPPSVFAPPPPPSVFAPPPPPASVFAPPPPLPSSRPSAGSAVPMPSPGHAAPRAPPPPPDSPLPGLEEAGFDDAALSGEGGLAEESFAGLAAPEDTSEPVTSSELAVVGPTAPASARKAEEPWDPGTSPDFGTIDLGGDDANATALPIPADDPLPAGDGMAWSEPAPAGDALDLSDLPQNTALRQLDGSPVDPLEFDPTRPAPEDLEADLSKPLPSPARPAEDGLEVLGFLDEAAKEIKPRTGRVTRYHVRRRSGKVFGPFEPGVIVKMLEDGQLLGSEEVSTDGDAWTGMAAVPTFSQAMQRLVSSPSPTAQVLPTKPGAATSAAPPKLDMDQLAQAYGGRMAVVSVVDGDAQARRQKRWLVLGAMVLAGVGVVGAAASLHFTKYGAFGLRWLFPAHVSSSSTEGKSFEEAKAGLAEDTWPGLRKARGLLDGLLGHRDVP